jgi:phage gp45-like
MAGGTLGAAWNSIRTMLSRATISAAAPGTQRTALQAIGYDGENYAGLALLMPYGMSAIPDAGDILVFRVAGLADHKVAIMADNAALRISDLGGGEFGFRDARGNQVVFRTDRLEVTAGGSLPIKLTSALNVEVDTPLLKCTGDILDNCNTQSETMASQRGVYDGHTHNIENIEVGGSTRVSDVPNQKET